MAAPSIWRPMLSRSRLPDINLCIGGSCLVARRAAAVATYACCFDRALSSSSTPRSSPHEPLRILFCGSDTFSCASLQALHNEMQSQKNRPTVADAPGRIESLDVVVRPAKRTGRGRTTITESPVKDLATQLGLPIHERDTFTGWSPPSPSMNMIVAVSFGLFVPKRLLRAARFGGLNVHPSLLPDLHGAAPIEHAILLGRSRTGVTVQTLDETTFDGGRRLLQGPYDGSADTQVGLPLPPRCTSANLHQLLAPLGANLLLEVLRRGLYLPEHANINVSDPSLERTAPAPKLTKADQQVPWRDQTAADIDRRARALGDLWTRIESVAGKEKRRPNDSSETASEPAKSKRAILGNVDLVAMPDSIRALLAARGPSGSSEIAAGLQAATFVQEDGMTRHCIRLPFLTDGESIIVPVGVDMQAINSLSCLRIGTIRVEGEKTRPAAQAMSAFACPGYGATLDKIAWDVALRT